MSNKTPQAAQYDPLLHREQHIEMLKERVFQIARWPHYQLLLDDLQELAGPPDEQVPGKIVSFERTLLYGGKSMFAPIFYGDDYRIVEMSPESAYNRGPYNADMVGPQFMEYGKPAGNNMRGGTYDLAIIPNALHHYHLAERQPWRHPPYLAAHSDFFYMIANKWLRPGGYLYIFEQCIEEIHQAPDDYVRYTPDGLSSLLQAAGYQIEWVRTTGNVFTSAAFLLDVALEYIEGTPAPEGTKPLDFGMTKGEDIRKVRSMIDRLKGMAPHYHTTGRKYTECPKAFSVLARKPT